MPESMKQKWERLGRDQAIQITAEVQGNYLNFEKNLAEKEKFVISKVSESQSLFGKCRLSAPRLQKLTMRTLGKEIRIWKQIFQKSGVFSTIILRKID